jgi:hypothetical protein
MKRMYQIGFAIAVCLAPARAQTPADPVRVIEQARESMRNLLKQGVDLSTAEARQRYLYDPLMEKIPDTLKSAVGQYIKDADGLIGRSATSGNFDVADRYFNSLADSVRISNRLGGPSLNDDLNAQAELARKNMCAAFPDACAASEPLKALDVASVRLGGSMSCALVGVSEQDVLCKPNLKYTLYCSYGGRVLDPVLKI